jgi:hypothetical protein
MLSGECRIDAVPVKGQAVLIDGLRLRLDLRLAPAAKPCADAQRTSPALLPRRVQRLAALAGLAALLLALAIWFAGAPVPSQPSSVPPPPPLPAPPVAVAPPQVAPVPQLSPVAPQVRPIAPPPLHAAPPPAARPVAKSPAPSRPPAPKAVAERPRATERELLDLFSDTK